MTNQHTIVLSIDSTELMQLLAELSAALEVPELAERFRDAAVDLVEAAGVDFHAMATSRARDNGVVLEPSQRLLELVAAVRAAQAFDGRALSGGGSR